jgi:hypothetical protein
LFIYPTLKNPNNQIKLKHPAMTAEILNICQTKATFVLITQKGNVTFVLGREGGGQLDTGASLFRAQPPSVKSQAAWVK